MANVVDLDDYKKSTEQRAFLNSLRELAELPVEWRFRQKAIAFMREHELSAPDLLAIFATAVGFAEYAGPRTIIVSGFTAEGIGFSLAVAFSEDPACLKILKGWKGLQQRAQQSA